MVRSKLKITAAVILSGLVHAVFLFYYSSASFNDEDYHSSLVSIQLEVVSQHDGVSAKDKIRSSSHLTSMLSEKDSNQLQSKQLREIHQPIKQPLDMQDYSSSVASLDNLLSHQSNLDNNVNQLSKLVYQEINRKKRYPYLAKRQRREGLVKLSFVLHPDGKVTDVSVVGSSQFSVLDRAAQKAVENISPFMLAADYLSYQQAFNVDVDFRLGKI